MTTQLYRYQLDKTGTNPDNLVENEEHTIEADGIRSIVPTYGAFFTTGFIINEIKDNVTTPLIHGRDYVFGELSRIITLQTNKEVVTSVLIINDDVNTNLTVSYQSIGGQYLNVAPIYNQIRDGLLNATVDWKDILNKDLTYPPSEHPHHIEDIYGFEHIVEALERIRQAILLGNTPSFEALIRWVENRVNSLSTTTCSDVLSGEPTDKLLTVGAAHQLFSSQFQPITYRISEVSIERSDRDRLSFTLTQTGEPKTLFYQVTYKVRDQVSRYTDKIGKTVGAISKYNIPVQQLNEPSDTTIEISFTTILGIKLVICGSTYNGATIPFFTPSPLVDYLTRRTGCPLSKGLSNVGLRKYINE